MNRFIVVTNNERKLLDALEPKGKWSDVALYIRDTLTSDHRRKGGTLTTRVTHVELGKPDVLLRHCFRFAIDSVLDRVARGVR